MSDPSVELKKIVTKEKREREREREYRIFIEGITNL
jgi:hypothetical protein